MAVDNHTNLGFRSRISSQELATAPRGNLLPPSKTKNEGKEEYGVGGISIGYYYNSKHPGREETRDRLSLRIVSLLPSMPQQWTGT